MMTLIKCRKYHSSSPEGVGLGKDRGEILHKNTECILIFLARNSEKNFISAKKIKLSLVVQTLGE